MTPGTGKYSMHFTSIVGKKPYQKTSGCLKASRSMPYVVYEGSTTHSFSGAPYVSGSAIYGMHLGAHQTNIGLDASYVQTMLELCDESTHWEDLLEEGDGLEYIETQRGDMIARTGHGYKAMSKDLRKSYITGKSLPSDVEFEEQKRAQGELLWADSEFDGECSQEMKRMLVHKDQCEEALNFQGPSQKSGEGRAIVAQCPLAGKSGVPASPVFSQRTTRTSEIPKSGTQTSLEGPNGELLELLESMLARRSDLSPSMRKLTRQSVRRLLRPPRQSASDSGSLC